MSAGDWKEMYNAAATGNMELVQYHIKNGVDPNYQHPEILSSALVASITNGHLTIAKFLLENGADPNLLSEFDNMTPLQAAKAFKRQEIIDILVKSAPPVTLLERLLRFMHLR
ncbi:ankyrin repeat domain-containing protein [Bdellovibrio bacteriovorus]|uniref:Uncharacterized protein n=1 Tax=Bdellovibrio bacteriovorus (strain ATCC 15356 / DSM 50701 / NCIMB 9529 / HD100) TaxID=264462 RepID=Q6MM57_BDEBA|nr:ankyrin repeat domain-containing protein [Bdellovibrio bacteriovorus]CAE79648.1 conserved hypothetical protein [Bdellovibrio bacteriovorus HD100]